MQPTTAPDPLKESIKYQKVSDLSSGSFGIVQLALNKETGEHVAIKSIERGDRVNRYVEAEILNHRMLRHPHVVEFKEVFLTSEFICIVMEYAAGGNLFTYVQRAVRLKEPAARWFFQQLVIGLDYCHRRGVVNRDIKLENTLLQMVPGLPLPLLKICDFGYSKANFMSAPKSKVGTLAYMAPEVIKTTGNYDGKQSDIWSCGVMLYVMLFGQYPFESPQAGQVAQAQRVQHMMNRILSVQWAIPDDADITSECRDLLSRMLIPEPSQRITMEQIQHHPWFCMHLPPDAIRMNDNFLANTDYSGVQSIEAIQQILWQARIPGPGKYNFNKVEEDGYEGLIEKEIHDELQAHQSSFEVGRYNAMKAANQAPNPKA